MSSGNSSGFPPPDTSGTRLAPPDGLKRPALLLRFGPDARRLALAEQLHVYDVGIATNGAVLDVLLLLPLRDVDGHDDPLSAGRANVRPLVRGPTSPGFASLHSRQFIATITCRPRPAAPPTPAAASRKRTRFPTRP